MGSISNPVADPPRDAMGHVTRISMGSSVYDEKCILCGATDARGDDRLNKPCPKADPPRDVPPVRYVLLNAGDTIQKGDEIWGFRWVYINAPGLIGKVVRELDAPIRRRADLAPAPAGVTQGVDREIGLFPAVWSASQIYHKVRTKLVDPALGFVSKDDCLLYVKRIRDAALTPQDAAVAALIERLRKPLFDDETIMTQWGRWRAYIAEGGKASLPRDEFEALLDWIDEDRQAAADALAAIRTGGK